jgi:tetratricopeptide (TPR) repeat protein
LAAVLYDRHLAIWEPGNVAERLAIATEVVRLAEASGDSVLALRGRGARMADLLELGDLDGLRADLDAYERTATALGQPHFQWHVPLFRAALDAIQGRFASAERLAADALAIGRRARDPVAPIYFVIVMVTMRWSQGRLPEMEAEVTQAIARFPANPGWRGVLAVLRCDAGRAEEARPEFERLVAHDVGRPAGDHLWLYGMAALSIVCHALGDTEHAPGLYELLLPYADLFVPVARLPIGSTGSVAHFLGLLALAMGRHDDAARHFTAAVQAHERMGALPRLASSRHFLGQALLARGGPGDLELARAHLDAAAELADRIGLRQIVR